MLRGQTQAFRKAACAYLLQKAHFHQAVAFVQHQMLNASDRDRPAGSEISVGTRHGAGCRVWLR